MKKLVLVELLLLSILVDVTSLPLDYAQSKVIAKFGVGIGSGLLSFGPDDGYEPFWPTSISLTKAGELFVLDYRQGIIKFDRDFRYVGSIKKIFHQFAVSEDRLIAWNSEAEAQELVAYSNKGSDLSLIATSLVVGLPKIEQVLIRGATVITIHQNGSFQLWLLKSDQGAFVKFTPSDSDLRKLNFVVRNGELQDIEFGTLDRSAETLFLINRKEEQQYAETTSGRDTVNISSGTVLGVDKNGFRTVLSRRKRLAVVSQSGDLIRVFDIRKDVASESRTEAICTLESGDILLLESTRNGHLLKRIERTW